MVTFWDTSACLPLLIREPSSPALLDLHGQLDVILIWTLTPVEVASSIFRLVRETKISIQEGERAYGVWQDLMGEMSLVRDVEMVKQRAIRLLRIHSLRAADALQLAAALVACSDLTSGHTLVTLDEKLAQAALKEGFRVLP